MHPDHTWLEGKLYINGTGPGAKIAIYLSSAIYYGSTVIGEPSLLFVQIPILLICITCFILETFVRAPATLDGYLIITQYLNNALSSIANEPIRKNNEPSFGLMSYQSWIELQQAINNRIHCMDTKNKAHIALQDSPHSEQARGALKDAEKNEQYAIETCKNMINNRAAHNVKPRCIGFHGKARLINRPELRIWHSCIAWHYAAVVMSILSVILMAISKYNNTQAYDAWSLVINTILTINNIVILCGALIIYNAMLRQIRAFYRLLAWEKLCESGCRIIEIHDNPNMETKYDIRPVKSTISSAPDNSHYYELTYDIIRLPNAKTENKVEPNLALRRVDLAKQLYLQALKEQQHVEKSLVSTINGLFAVIAVLWVLMVLPNKMITNTTVDVLYATTLAVQTSALVYGSDAIITWRRTSYTYTEACWMLELANNRFSAREARYYERYIDLAEKLINSNRTWFGILWTNINMNHTVYGPEFNISLTT